MADIHRTRTIAARIGDIWETLADFGSISSWADNVDHSCILFSGPDGAAVGTARRVQVKRDALVERVTEFDPPRALGYDIEGLPARLRRVSNRWTLQPAAGASAPATLVTLTSTVEIGPHATQKLAERVLCRFLARQSETMLAGLANRLEHARV
ncbi:SRPBCC family protein [Mycobacterium nebraskense]|uniref:Cyclase n=1 Tax=Mycobacterium nebraskense TaxID=244292 RepID=A0A0F5NI17_9MYCO|nr:SRPBCC family protein [Mycobacterium nebraskense]KKC06617.1 cyclase [Mycobacterium nebraskense]KLO44644.1 cyclase [Mycobacterium nebraskense]MBI2695703.1 SRPBCC family protein [Mycobacterium nebraskense]MCV7119932.1 SRPBCC family protein [Mycobacterium nebraskense]ORW17035.1 cyclase [Mycobacterium nebraskense]